MTPRTMTLGDTDDGTMTVTVTLGQTSDPLVSATTHEEVPAGAPTLSISGEVVAHRAGGDVITAGQCRDMIGEIVYPAAGWGFASLDELAQVWERWHLNDMRAGCAHQSVVWETDVYGLSRPSLDLTLPCPASGYRYGSSWLYEPLPDDVLHLVQRVLMS